MLTGKIINRTFDDFIHITKIEYISEIFRSLIFYTDKIMFKLQTEILIPLPTCLIFIIYSYSSVPQVFVALFMLVLVMYTCKNNAKHCRLIL